MTKIDTESLCRLLPYVDAALAAQEPHVADQLRAAMRDRQTELRFERSVVGVVAIVVVAGHELVEVDLRNLLDPEPIE